MYFVDQLNKRILWCKECWVCKKCWITKTRQLNLVFFVVISYNILYENNKAHTKCQLSKERVVSLCGCKYLHSAYVQFIFAKFARVCPSMWPKLSRSGDSKLVPVQYNPRGVARRANTVPWHFYYPAPFFLKGVDNIHSRDRVTFNKLVSIIPPQFRGNIGET